MTIGWRSRGIARFTTPPRTDFFLKLTTKIIFCSEKYAQIACRVVRCSWGAGSGIIRTPTAVMPPLTQQKDVRDVATPSHPALSTSLLLDELPER